MGMTREVETAWSRVQARELRESVARMRELGVGSDEIRIIGAALAAERGDTAVSYVYRPDPERPVVWNTGYYDPAGVWVQDRDHSAPELAAERAAWLNGSGRPAGPQDAQ